MTKNMKNKKLNIEFLIIGVLSSILILLPALSQAKKDKKEFNQKDLKQMATDISNLKTTTTTQGKTVATMKTQMSEMVSNFQTMNGNIGSNEKKNESQDKVLTDTKTRLQTLEDKISLLVSQLTELRKEGLMKPQSSKRFDEYVAYAKALEFVNAKDYKKAIQELKNFQKTHKKSIFNSYAQYWIGESYYLQSDYPMAIKEYQRLISRNSRSSKAPSALYKQGLSFYHMQSFDDAKAFFSKVIRSYPRTIEAVQSSSHIYRINTIQKLKKQQEFEMNMVR